MRRNFATVLLGLLMAPLAGCADDTREGPAVTVQRLDVGRGCHIHCDASAPLAPAVASALGVRLGDRRARARRRRNEERLLPLAYAGRGGLVFVD